jgi:hypothetical protein
MNMNENVARLGRAGMLLGAIYPASPEAGYGNRGGEGWLLPALSVPEGRSKSAPLPWFLAAVPIRDISLQNRTVGSSFA